MSYLSPLTKKASTVIYSAIDAHNDFNSSIIPSA